MSEDVAQTWRRVGGPPGEPQALGINAGSWHVATSESILRSAGDGRTREDLGAPVD